MLRKYARASIVAGLLIIVLTSSGCYTVLKMRSETVSYPEYDSYDITDYSYDPYFDSYYSHYLSCLSGYYFPWTYWCGNPNWSYPYYVGTRYYGYDPYVSVPLVWQKGERRRGFTTRTVSHEYLPPAREVDYGSTVVRDGNRLKELRRVGTGTGETPARRSNITPTPTPASRTDGTSAPAVSSRSSSSSNTSRAVRSESSSPATRRRGAKP